METGNYSLEYATGNGLRRSERSSQSVVAQASTISKHQTKRRRIAADEGQRPQSHSAIPDLECVRSSPGTNDVQNRFEGSKSEVAAIAATGKDIQLSPLTNVSQSEAALLLAKIRESPANEEALMRVVSRKLHLNERQIKTDHLGEGFHFNRLACPLPTGQTATSVAAMPQVLEALHEIRATPYERSFLSRILVGAMKRPDSSALAIDWQTTTPWMDLMQDIRTHYAILHPEEVYQPEPVAPIEYTHLQSRHIDQVHDLLRQAFWSGIQVSDSLEYSPDRCTVVAVYKRLVVGVAILSSPQETYITYLTVKTGWDRSHIATSMLYHLIKLNPDKDINLHVSANNPAMLLYNRFGFKAEEFIAGFYEDYLDPHSRASKNAFRLRLRR